jgi:predicted RecA/RadA family phage recombinase
MSDNMRWRYGDTNPVVAAVDSATVIEIGDLLWQDTDDAKPSSDFTYGVSLAATQDSFVDEFLGVAMQRSRSGDTADIRVAGTGVFEFPCASSTFELGDLIGPDDNSGGTALENQKVIKVTDPARAVGRVAKRVATAATTVLVDIRSNVMTGGILGNTSSGS